MDRVLSRSSQLSDVRVIECTLMSIIIMSILCTAPELSNLLPVLADLPADKIFQFAIALGVPETVIRTAETNRQGDVDRVKLECLQWWISNSDDITWEAISRALETRGVDQKNLARRIQSGQCEQSFSAFDTSELATFTTF